MYEPRKPLADSHDLNCGNRTMCPMYRTNAIEKKAEPRWKQLATSLRCAFGHDWIVKEGPSPWYGPDAKDGPWELTCRRCECETSIETLVAPSRFVALLEALSKLASSCWVGIKEVLAVVFLAGGEAIEVIAWLLMAVWGDDDFD